MDWFSSAGVSENPSHWPAIGLKGTSVGGRSSNEWIVCGLVL